MALKIPDPIHVSELSTIKMVAGNEKKFTKIIHDGFVRHWVGIGWIEIRKPTLEDTQTIPASTAKKPHASKKIPR